MCKKDAFQIAIRCLRRHFKYPQIMAIFTNRAFYKVLKIRICRIPEIWLKKKVLLTTSPPLPSSLFFTNFV
jgi:hypothetical protein